MKRVPTLSDPRQRVRRYSKGSIGATRLHKASEHLARAKRQHLELRASLRRLSPGPERDIDVELREAVRIEIEDLKREIEEIKVADREVRAELHRKELAILRRGGPPAEPLRRLKEGIASAVEQRRICREAERLGRRLLAAYERKGTAKNRLERFSAPGSLPRALKALEKQRIGPYLRWMKSRMRSYFKTFSRALEGIELPAGAERVRVAMAKGSREPDRGIQDVHLLMRLLETRSRQVEQKLDKLDAQRIKILSGLRQ